ncbi:hypothetical protein EES39_09580 [Streptomyces sp. ADI92-24]|nr:hypothetical protein EES39_09580 [Streptomyces sp. ADI92-24]
MLGLEWDQATRTDARDFMLWIEQIVARTSDKLST